MKRNDLYRKDDSVLRVIHVQENQVIHRLHNHNLEELPVI